MGWKNFMPGFKIEKKASAASPLHVAYGLREPKFTPRQYDRLAEEGYQKNVIVYRAIRLIAQNAASIPWTLHKGKGAHKARLADHPVLSLLERPNPCQGGAELFEAIFGFFLIAGNSYIEAVGPRGDVPLELWTLRPDRVRVVPNEQGLPGSYRYSVGGRSIDFAVDPVTHRSNILHAKSFHPLNDFYGMSPLEAAAVSIDQHNDAARWNAALLQNSGRPSGALVYTPSQNGGSDHLTDEQRQHLRQELERFFTSSDNAGRPLVLEGGLDWREMSLSPKDMDWLAGKDVSAREIALAFNVPPQLIGIDGSLTFANFEQARLALYDDAVLPLVDHFKDELNNWLCPMFGDDLKLDIDRDRIEALSNRREKVWERVSKADFLTLNEKRAAVGLSPVQNGNTIAGALAP